MEELTNLRPFVWFCQFSGFIPFRMEIDPETKKFQRFSFSFRHPLTWWFAFVKIMGLGVLYSDFYVIQSLLSKADDNLQWICSLCQEIFQVAIVVVVQLVLLRVFHLIKAIEWARKADETWASAANMAVHTDNVIYRTFAGIFFTLCAVKLMFFLFSIHFFIHLAIFLPLRMVAYGIISSIKMKYPSLHFPLQ